MLLIIDNESDFIKRFEKDLLKSKVDFVVLPYNDTEAFNLIKSKVTSVILSGGPGIPGNPSNLNADYLAIDQLDVPIIGLCLGAEVVAHAFGGKITKLPTKQDKEQVVKILKKDPIFDGLHDVVKLREKHYYQISELPKDFEIIASSQVCSIEAMKHKQKPIYAFQGHPEVSGDDGHTIMHNFLKVSGINF
jgi:GMP synthase (glutamine-hydrolysing) A subunit